MAHIRASSAWFVFGTLGLAGCRVLDSDTNHPPAVEPLSLAGVEDQGVPFTLHASDEDGDDLELSFSWSARVTIDRVVQHRTDGTTQLEAECILRAAPDYNGDAGFYVLLSDGTDKTELWFDAVIDPVNDPPIAVADAIAASINTAAAIAHTTLLANDSDRDDDEDRRDPLAIASVDTPFGGTMTLAADTITFTPDTDFVGTASFRYTLSDGAKTDHAIVRLAVGGPNAAPIAADDEQGTVEGAPFEIPAPHLTANDVDHDGQTLAITGVGNATRGTVLLDRGTVTFDPDDFFYGTAGFDYTVTDGVATDTAHVDVEVAPLIY